LSWDEIYSHLIATLGWSYEYIDEHMTFPRFKALVNYWKLHPPVHVLLAGFVGYKPSLAGKDSWIERKLTYEQCLAEAQKPHELKEDIHAFAAELKEMGVGFSIH
jgi:hypothetical protein